MATIVEVKGGKLIITLDMNETGERSTSGKTMVHASTHGNIATSVIVNGKPLVVGVNAYTK
jgi:hypothetical protein